MSNAKIYFKDPRHMSYISDMAHDYELPLLATFHVYHFPQHLVPLMTGDPLTLIAKLL